MKSGVPVKESFLATLEKRYSAESYSFSDAADATARINSWVYNKTNGMIDKIIEYLDRSAAIVLVNIVYLKANWTTPFETVINDVFNSPKGPTRAEYLSGEVEAKLLESDEYVAVALSYAGTDVKFVALMPKKASLEEFASKLSEKDLLNVLSSVLGRGGEKVKLLMPKFDVDSGMVELRPILEGMGVRRVFDPERADLSEMLDYSKLAGEKAYVSNVFHRARVKVDLYGTEAAAATAVVVKVTAARPEKMKTVRIDRPFLFFLVDPTSSAVLFAGSFVEP